MAYTLIKGGLLIDTEWMRHQDILIEGSKIKRVAPAIDVSALPADTATIDASGLCVLPGIIDAHTHYHLVSRGTVTADSFEEGSRLAAFGGVTTVVDFADDDKKSLLGSFNTRRREMAPMAIDYTLHQGVYAYRDDISEELKSIAEAGVGTLKIFTTYRDVGYLVEKRDELLSIFRAARDLGLLVTVHSEDDRIITEIGKNWKGGYKPADHASLRPSEAEAEAIRYVGGIAEELDMPVYIVHLSSKEGLEAVRELRARGVTVYVETTPHYLFLDKSKLEGPDGPLYVMTPPLRTAEDNKALQEALLEGEIQVVPPLVGLPDGAGGGHVRGVAGVADAAAVEVGRHGVRQAVHPVLLAAAAGDVGVVLLGGWAEIDRGHGATSCRPILCGGGKAGARPRGAKGRRPTGRRLRISPEFTSWPWSPPRPGAGR